MGDVTVVNQPKQPALILIVGEPRPYSIHANNNGVPISLWSADFTLIIGITSTGRATANALRLNRPGVVNLRRILVLAGEHPPEEK